MTFNVRNIRVIVLSILAVSVLALVPANLGAASFVPTQADRIYLPLRGGGRAGIIFGDGGEHHGK